MESPATVTQDAFDRDDGNLNSGFQEPEVPAIYCSTRDGYGHFNDEHAGSYVVSNTSNGRTKLNGALMRIGSQLPSAAEVVWPASTVTSGVASSSQALGGRPKRVLDIVVAATALILLAPLLIMVAALILLSLKRPIIYSQMRVGHGGQLFKCYKFRTMVNDSDAVLKRHLANDFRAAEEWKANQKLVHDPRVTFVGRLLRKSSIDELPQLINVVRGEMSCVGPRPIIPDELQRYGAARDDYLRAKPGMTGLWQVSGRNALGYEARVALDSTYVHQWSLQNDILILLKTVPAVMRFGETA